MAELNRQVSKKPKQTWQELGIPRVAWKGLEIELGWWWWWLEWVQ